MLAVGATTLLGIFVLPAVVFALVYVPIVTKISRACYRHTQRPMSKGDCMPRPSTASWSSRAVSSTGIWTSCCTRSRRAYLLLETR
jgi:hypothetical protein